MIRVRSIVINFCIVATAFLCIVFANNTMPEIFYRVFADDEYYKEYYDYTISNGEVTITGVVEDADVAYIPDTLDGYPVTAIGDYAFYERYNLDTIKIGKNVTSIGDFAFSLCPKLKEVTIPDNVVYFGEGIFQNNHYIETLSIASFGKTKDGKDITHIGYYFGASDYTQNAQYVSAKMKEVTLRAGTIIPAYAFYECEKLEDVFFSDSITSIGESAFYGCSKLDIITIPDSVTDIGKKAFYGCTQLAIINLSYNLKNISEEMFANCTNLTSITIPANVENIERRAFYQCQSLSKITFSDGLKSIESGAFEFCTRLTTITVPDSVEEIAQYAFGACTKLEKITLPFVGNKLNGTENTYFGYIFGATSYSSSGYVPSTLKEIVITGGTIIRQNAFYGYKNLDYITILDGVEVIEKGAFLNCSGIDRLTIPFVGNKLNGSENTHFSYIFGAETYNAEYNASAVTELIINGNSKICDYAFTNSPILYITFEAGVTDISPKAFFDADGVSVVTVSEDNAYYSSSNGVLYNKDKTLLIFVPDRNVSDYVIPESVSTIGYGAFMNCTSLSAISIPYGVTSIESYAFSGCSRLKNVIISGSVTDIAWNAFDDCDYLVNFDISEDNPSYTGIDGIIYNKDKTVIYNCATGKSGSIVIPYGVKKIEFGAFYNCDKITDIIILKGITDICDSAFTGCTKLGDVYYAGTEAEWDSIKIYDGCTEDFRYVTKHFNYGISVGEGSSIKVNKESGFVSSIETGNTVSDISSQFNSSEQIVVSDSNGNVLANDSVIATGNKIQLVVDGVVVEEMDAVVAGDTDGDGVATITDTQNAYSLLMGGEPVSGIYAEAAKATGGSSLSILDVMAILNMV